MKECHLIGLAGPSGVGKSTVAALLNAIRGFEHQSFAAPIRAAVLAAVPHWDAWHVTAGKDRAVRTFDGGSISPRHLMRAIGAHGRAMNPQLYVEWASRQWRRVQEQGKSVVLDDVRFDLEAEWIRVAGGTVVHVYRPGIEYSQADATEMGVGYAAGDMLLPNESDICALCGALGDLLTVLGVKLSEPSPSRK